MYDKAISYSGLSLYRKCPAAWADAYIEGNRSESGPAALRGTKLHEKLDQYFKTGSLEILGNDSTLRKWGPYMTQLRQHEPESELDLGATLDWEPAGFDSGEANVRGAIDLRYQTEDELVITDWKSGKIYDTHQSQGEFYVALSASYIEVPNYRVVMTYLDQFPHSAGWVYTWDEAKILQGVLGEEVAALRQQTEYLPTPSNEGCKWCKLSWRNGGKCHAAY